MLYDMLDSLGIRGRCTEADGKNLVGIIIADHKDTGLGPVMPKYITCSVNLGKLL